MSLATHHEPHGLRDLLGRSVLSAPAVFAAGAFAVVATMVLSRTSAPTTADLPGLVIVLLLAASIAAALAGVAAQRLRENRLTYWDVAGVFTFAAICAAAAIEPAEMVRWVESAD